MSVPNYAYHSVLLADSRAKGFPAYDTGKLYTYNQHYVIKPGAKIIDLTSDAIDKIRDIPVVNTKVLVKIAAGINNLNSKISRPGCYEIAPSAVEPENLLHELNELKDRLKEIRSDIIVSYITIPPVNYLQQLKYWQDKKRLTNPIHPEHDRLRFQKEHEEKIIQINKQIKEHNCNEQQLIRCQTSSWHSEVLRLQKGKHRLVVSALVDGIHASDTVKQRWHKNYHQSVQKEIRQLQSL